MPQLAAPERSSPEKSPKTPSLRSKAIRGGALTILGHGTGQVLRFASNVVLARLLVPDAFGLMQMVLVFLGGLQMLSDVGIQAAVVRHPKRVDQEFLDTAYTLQFVRGVVLFLIGIALAKPFAAIYDTPGLPSLAHLIPVACLTALMLGAQSTKAILIQRDLMVGRWLIKTLGSRVLAIITAIVLAAIHPSVWALVWSAVVGIGAEVLLSFVVLPGRNNRFRWNKEVVRELLHFGKWIFLSTLLTFLAIKMDVILLGHLVTPKVLGIYSIALLFAAAPQELCGKLTNTVFLPTLSESLRQGRDAFDRSFRGSRAAFMPLSMFMIAAVALLSKPVIQLLYPGDYQDATWMARYAMLAVWFFFLQNFGGRVLLALGDSRSVAMGNLVKLAVTIGAMLYGHHVGGFQGILLGVVIGSICGQLTIVGLLALHKVPTLAQDIRYTLGGLMIFVAGEAVPWLLESSSPWLALVCSAAVLGPVGFYIGKKAWINFRRK